MDDELRRELRRLEAKVDANTRAINRLNLASKVAHAVAERRAFVFGRLIAVVVSGSALASVIVTVWYHR